MERDAKKEKCFICNKKADVFVFIPFKPNIDGKPICNKCIEDIEKQFFNKSSIKTS